MMTPRKHNFTPVEKKIFLKIIKKYSSVIENKKTDNVSAHAKNEAWNSISKVYNASPHVHKATSLQLRRLYTNLKRREKEALAKALQPTCAASGEIASSGEVVIDADIAEVARALIVGASEPFDSDTAPESGDDANESQLSASKTPSTSPPSYTAESPFQPLYECSKTSILDKEYRDRQLRANQRHALEVELLQEQIKEAKAKAREAEAKADLAELMVIREQNKPS